MDVVIGALLFIAILIAIAVLRRRIRRSVPLRTPEDLQRNRDECQAEFDDAEHDLTVATELRDNRGQRTWAELCRELGHKGRNPALSFMQETPDGDEPEAHAFFEKAVEMLEQVYAKARENLEMAQSLMDDENEEA